MTKQSIESESTQLSQSLDQQVSDDAPQLRAANHGHKDIPKGLEQNRYQSNRFGYSFIYPDGYDLTVTQADDSTEEYVTLLRMEDVGEPEPPFIGIQVYENPQQLSLEDFRNQKSYLIINEFPDIDVAGQRALDFEWAGLYEAREHLFKTPDGTHVVALNSTYLDVISDADPLWLDAQKIRDSFEWRSPSANSGNAANPDSFAIAQVQPFTFEELFEQEAGGCGMNLLQPNAAPGEGFLFTHGIDNAPALMKINGQWVELSRTEAKGEEFYGQYTSQTFVSEEDDITVQIDVQLGELGEIESVEFADVQFKVMQDNQVVEVTAIGGAGC
ncbi:MAG: hypothetical protein AAGD25_28015 [Cyanobacteria bacterium P01_F01_bin.150]